MDLRIVANDDGHVVMDIEDLITICDLLESASGKIGITYHNRDDELSKEIEDVIEKLNEFFDKRPIQSEG